MWAGCWRMGPRPARVRRKETGEVRIGCWPVLADDHSHDPLSSSSSLLSFVALLTLLSSLLSLSSLSLLSSFFSWLSSLYPRQPEPPYPSFRPYPPYSSRPLFLAILLFVGLQYSCHPTLWMSPIYTSCTLNRHQSRTCSESQHQHILPYLNSLCEWWHNWWNEDIFILDMSLNTSSEGGTFIQGVFFNWCPP